MGLDRKTKEVIRMEKFEDIYTRFKLKSLTTHDAAELLGISERQFLRQRGRYDDEGLEGLIDRRVGKESPLRARKEETDELERLYSTRFKGFSVSHFYSFLKYDFDKYNFEYLRSYSWVKNTLTDAKLISVGKKGGDHRQRRPRRPRSGMMLHQDGSTHNWFGSYNCDLIITMDDANSEITSGFFCKQEGTYSSMRGIKETIEKYGIFCELYSDRGTHYFYTPEAGGKVDKGKLTQLGRALKELGIQHIPAYSPEARGRSERMFQTIQNRLPKELEMMNIRTMKEANEYLINVYIPKHNKEFCVQPEDAETAFMNIKHISLDEILCLKESRTVNKDNTVSYKGLILQIPQNKHRYNYVKCNVEVREYLNGTISIYYGHLNIANFDRFVGQGKHKRVA
jgi:hypothetical protein